MVMIMLQSIVMSEEANQSYLVITVGKFNVITPRSHVLLSSLFSRALVDHFVSLEALYFFPFARLLPSFLRK